MFQNKSYKEIVLVIKEIRDEYDLICKKFKYFELHKKVLYKESVKNEIYNSNLKEYQKNNIWLYLNGNIPYRVLAYKQDGIDWRGSNEKRKHR